MEGSTQVPAHLAMWNPLAPIGRSWRRLRRRPRALQIRTALIVVAIVVGLVAWVVFAPSGTPGGTGGAGAAEVASASSTTATPVSQASTSTRGVSKTEINVVFPVVAVNSQAGKFGFADGQGVQRADPRHQPLREPDQQVRRDQRSQDQPDDRAVRPEQRGQQQALCRQWTQGRPGRLRRRRRHRHLDRRRPALRDPAGTDAADQRLVDDHQLDQPRLALSVVDRGRHGARPGRDRAVGSQLGPPRPRQEGRRRGVRPGAPTRRR